MKCPSSSRIKCMTFYCCSFSGLTNKTQLSFTSSNSSFTECVRKQRIHAINIISNACPTTESEFICEGQTFGSNDNQSPSFSSIFSKCTFSECSAYNGGTIYFSVSSQSLTVEDCSFNHCSCSSENGGAIYIDSGSELSITSSKFIACVCPKYGGGVFAYNHCEFSTVSFCTFQSCTCSLRWRLDDVSRASFFCLIFSFHFVHSFKCWWRNVS